jgi:hypothetical protein
MAIIHQPCDITRSENLTTQEVQEVLHDKQLSEADAAQIADAVYTYCFVVYGLCASKQSELPDNVRLLSSFSNTLKNAV